MIDLHVAVIASLVRRILGTNTVGAVTASSSESFSPVAPQVAPEGVNPFDDAFSGSLLKDFGAKALVVNTFEEFSDLLANVVETTKLDLLNDLPKVAQLFNRHRMDNNLPPL